MMAPSASAPLPCTCHCVRKGDPLQGLSVASCLTLETESFNETRADKARDFAGKGHPGRKQQGEGTQENCSAMQLTVSGVMVTGLPIV